MKKIKRSRDFLNGESFNQVIEYEPNIEGMKGRTTIQLFESGNIVKEVVSDNFIGLAMNNFFETTTKNNLFYSLVNQAPTDTAMSPIKFLKLINDDSVELPNDDLFSRSKYTGHCRLDTTSVYDNSFAGIVNSAETHWDPILKRHRFVVDFATDRANGTFKEIHLTTEMYNSNPNRLYVSGRERIYSKRIMKASDSRVGALHDDKSNSFIIISSDYNSISKFTFQSLNLETGEVKNIKTPQAYTNNVSTSSFINMWKDNVKNIIYTLPSLKVGSSFVVYGHNPETFEIVSQHKLEELIPELMSSGSTYYIKVAKNKLDETLHFFATNSSEVVLNYVKTKNDFTVAEKILIPISDFRVPSVQIIQGNGKSLFLIGTSSSNSEINVYSVDDFVSYSGFVIELDYSRIICSSDADNQKIFVVDASSSSSQKIVKLFPGTIGAKNVLPHPITKDNSQTMKIIYDIYIENLKDLSSDKESIIPSNIANLKGEIQSDFVLLDWDISTDPNVIGYFIYINGVKRNIDPISSNSFRLALDDLSLNMIYKLYVTTADRYGNESGYDDYFLVDRKSPETVSNLQAIESEDNRSVTLVWDLLDDDVKYNIYQDDVKIGEVDNLSTFKVDNLLPETQYNFHIVAIDKFENEGLPCEKVYVDMSYPTTPINLTAYSSVELVPSNPDWNSDIKINWLDNKWLRNVDYKGVPTLSNNKISHSMTTSTQFEININKNSNINITYSIESEGTHDPFRLYIDGVEKLVDSGLKERVQTSIPISEGMHTIKLEYRKDGSSSVGLDSVFIEKFIIDLDGQDILIWDHEKEVDFKEYKIYLDSVAIGNTKNKMFSIADHLIKEQPQVFEVSAIDLSEKESEKVSLTIS